jgi:hypothetical protein
MLTHSHKPVHEKCYKAGVLSTSDAATTPVATERSHTWDIIKYEDVVWKKRVWRTIDVNNEINRPLTGKSLNTSFAEVLYAGAANNTYGVYSDERFNQFAQNDLKTLKNKYALSSVTSYRIKEDWIMTKDNQMHVRIIAIAPILTVNGTEETPLWFYYPDTRKYLYDHKIPGSEIADLEEFFEGRFFSSKIEKESGGIVEHKHGTKW